MELANKVALITGGSRGLGLALAHALGKRGAKVAIVARHEADLERAVAGLKAAGVTAMAIAADVSDKEAIYPLIGRVQGTLGPIDILVHNASTLGAVPLRPLAETDCEVLQHTLDVNVVAPFRLSKALVGGMLVRGSGLVLHVSSDAAVSAYPNWGPYAVSKAALDHLSRQFAVELADGPVRVLSVDPGEMNTEMHRAALPEADPSELQRPEQVAERIVTIIDAVERFPSGARVIAAEVESAR